MDDEWISAAEALALLTTTMALEVATGAIWDWAGADLVFARAKRFVTIESGERTSENDCAVPGWFWSRRWLLSETWETGDFKVAQHGAGAQAYGVEFRRAEIEAMAPKQSETHSPKKAVRTAGRRQSERWRPWIAELVAYFHEAGVPEGTGSQGQQEVIDAIEDRLARRGVKPLSRSTVQPVVQAVLDRLRSTED